MKRKKKFLLFKDAAQCLLLSVILTGILSLLVVNATFFNPFMKMIKEFSYLDVYYSERMDDNQFNSETLIVNIEHRNRSEIATLLNKVQQGKPKVIGIDILFTSQKEREIDALLAKELKAPNIVQGFILSKDSIIRNHPDFRNSNQGFVIFNFNADESVIRNFTGFHEIDGVCYTSFGTHISKLAIGENNWNHLNYDSALNGETPISYQGDMNTFLTFGYDEFLALDDLSLLTDKIVL